MSKDSEPESRPISVSELLARAQGADAARPRTEGRGRRRAGRDGAVSVGELTGEIPKIAAGRGSAAPAREAATKSDPVEPDSVSPESEKPEPADAEAPPAAPTTEPAKSEPAKTEPAKPEPAKPEPAKTEQRGDERSRAVPFPRSTSPVPRRGTDEHPTASHPHPGRPGGRRDGLTASGMPTFGDVPPPATRDFSSDSVARRLSRRSPVDPDPVDERSANAVTGIIPVVGDGGEDTGLVVVESDDVVTHDLAGVGGLGPDDDHDDTDTRHERSAGGFSEVMDFDSYRNFEDVEDSTTRPVRTPSEKRTPSAGGVKRLIGLGAAKLGKKLAERKRPGTQSSTDEPQTTPSPATESGRDAFGRVDATTPDERTETDDDRPTGVIERVRTDDRFDAAESDRPHVDLTKHSDPESPVADDAVADDAVADDAVGDDAVADSAVADDARAVEETTDLDETDGDGAGEDESGPIPASHLAYGQVPAERTDADTGAGDEAADSDFFPDTTDTTGAETGEDTGVRDEPSPVKAWLLVLSQAIIGLAVGVGLFWGFTELWRWSPIFALVLAVVVTFGIVTLSHVVRRTKDLPTTLLALGVGLLVTIGPLVLLAT